MLVRPIRSTLFYFYFTQVSYMHLMQLNDPMCLPAFIFIASPPLHSTVMIYDGITVEDFSAMVDISPVSM